MVRRNLFVTYLTNPANRLKSDRCPVFAREVGAMDLRSPIAAAFCPPCDSSLSAASRYWLARVVTSPAILRTVVAAILLFAAGMKTYALFVADGQSYSSFHIPIWVVEQSVIVEWALGAWLLLGVFAYAAWVCSIICFAIFLCITLVAGASGASVCPCFGFFSTSPWLTALMDCSVLVALFVFRPSHAGWGRDAMTDVGTRRLLVRAGCLLFTISTTAVVFASGVLAQSKAGQQRNVASMPNVGPPFILLGDPADCSATCISTIGALARAELGLDPAWPDHTIPTDAKKLLSMLREAAKSVDSSIQAVPVEEVLSNMVASTIPPVVLVSRDDHLCLLLGAIDVDGELMYQLLHGDSAVTLATKAKLLKAGFKEAWRLKGKGAGVPIEVGTSCELLVNRVLHNFGEVKPDESLHCKFQLTNTGLGTIIVDKPRTSCGCTTTDLSKARKLRPGETTDVEVFVQSKGSPSMEESVVLTAFEQDSSIPRHQELLLLGCQRPLMAVVPSSIDFGTVVPGEAYYRTVRMNEVDTDEFTVTRVDSGKVPITHEVVEAQNADGLSTYRIQLGLKVDHKWVGKQLGELTIATSSRFRPQLKIPVRFEVQPNVRVEPSVMAFGAVKAGRISQQRVQIVSRDAEAPRVQVVSVPKECSVKIAEESLSSALIATVQLNRVGVWQDSIKVQVANSKGKEAIEINCTAYVRE